MVGKSERRIRECLHELADKLPPFKIRRRGQGLRNLYVLPTPAELAAIAQPRREARAAAKRAACLDSDRFTVTGYAARDFVERDTCRGTAMARRAGSAGRSARPGL